MSDIFREVDEDLRRDQFVRLWKRHGGFIVAVVLAVVLVTAGTVGWQRWQRSAAQAETMQLATALRQVDGDGGEGSGATAAADMLAMLAADAGAGRDIVARFYEAALRAEEGDRDAAIRIYGAIAADAEPVYRDLAVLLGVLNQVDEGEPAALRTRLAPLTGEESPWRHSARELDALLALRAGDRSAAANLFARLAEDATAPQGVRSRATELAAVYAEEK
ncbi:MAG TPA: tetratricopeptide repeat protein [Arenibaculum sp.]|nr:tetratricopeptide repeat protein [Arenibaculum sp.]